MKIIVQKLHFTNSTKDLVQNPHFTDSTKKGSKNHMRKLCTMGNMRKSRFTNSTENGAKKKRSQLAKNFKTRQNS